jgi:hypothetical protein
MAKFIRIKNHLINIDKVYDFELCDHTIFVSYSGCESDMCIEFANRQEAALVFDDIPHLIDNTHIPKWVREASEPIPCKPEYFNLDYEYDELPF